MCPYTRSTVDFFSSKCSLFHNSNVFGSCIIHILYTWCAKIENNNSGAKRLMCVLYTRSTVETEGCVTIDCMFKNSMFAVQTATYTLSFAIQDGEFLEQLMEYQIPNDWDVWIF